MATEDRWRATAWTWPNASVNSGMQCAGGRLGQAPCDRGTVQKWRPFRRRKSASIGQSEVNSATEPHRDDEDAYSIPDALPAKLSHSFSREETASTPSPSAAPRLRLLPAVVARMRGIMSTHCATPQIGPTQLTDGYDDRLVLLGRYSLSTSNRFARSSYWALVRKNVPLIASPGFGQLPRPITHSIYDVAASLREASSAQHSLSSASSASSSCGPCLTSRCPTSSVCSSMYNSFRVKWERKFDKLDGFSACMDAYGSSSIWTDKDLLSLRLSTPQLLRRTKLLSFGDISEVWLGVYNTQQVIVKRLRGDLQRMVDVLAFVSELKTTATLQHPQLVQFIGVEWTKGFEIQAVTEYMAGGDLRSLLSSETAGSLTWADYKCAIAIDVAEALEYLHSLHPKIILYDLHSRHVLLDDQFRAKINTITISRKQTIEHASCGKLEATYWLAPEVVRQDRFTELADIYSLGVLLTELDNCKPTVAPHRKLSSASWKDLYSHLGKMRRQFSELCPESIVALANECMADDPQLRPSAASILYRLRAILKNELW